MLIALPIWSLRIVDYGLLGILCPIPGFQLLFDTYPRVANDSML